MRDELRRVYRAVTAPDAEIRTVVRFVRQAAERPSAQILDVGCGYGRYLRALREAGLDVTGVDLNAVLVAANRAAGLKCMLADELVSAAPAYDVLLMSHVIEHFRPDELVHFMDKYLDLLRPGGHLIIATPLLSSNFYDDFDHVRPYQPIGLDMVFGTEKAQVQYYARNPLKLVDIWFRRSPWRPTYVRARYVRSPKTRALQLVEFASALAFWLTGSLLGRTDGWVGLFQKVGPLAPDQIASPS